MNKTEHSPDLSVQIGRLRLKNPVTVASGTFGFGEEYRAFYDVGELGAIFVKGLTLEEREGNAPPRIAETAAGMINSIGLQNPGVEGFLNEIVPSLRNINTAIIANIAGSTHDEYLKVAGRLCAEKAVDAIELNVSCPNVKEGGIEFGRSEKHVAKLTRAVVNEVAPMPVIVKLTPLVSDIGAMAQVAEQEGAAAVSLINTLPAMKVYLEKEGFVSNCLMGGLSGPAIKPVALRLIHEASTMISIPIIGIGGICNLEDVLEFMYAGADVVSIGTANFINPTAPLDILHKLSSYMIEKNLASLHDLKEYLRKG